MLIIGNNVYQMLTKQHIEKNSSTFKKKLTLQETLLASGFQFGCKTKSLITG